MAKDIKLNATGDIGEIKNAKGIDITGGKSFKQRNFNIGDTIGMTVAGQMQKSFFMGAGIVLALVIGYEMWKHKAITKIFSK